MIWTQRFQFGLYEGVYRDTCQIYERRIFGNYPQWMFPMVRRDRLENMIRRRYPKFQDDWQAFYFLVESLPVFDQRGTGGRFNYYDLRVVSPLLPKEGKTASMERCRACGKVVTRGQRQYLEVRSECSQECFRVISEREFKKYLSRERKRKREWTKIKECRELLKQARALLRNQPHEVS